MASTSRLPHSTLKTYHTNGSLLYQFILSEFLISYKEVKKISPHVAKLNATPLHLLTKREYEGLLNQISASIAVMAGSSQEYMRLFTWNLTEGTVAKLKNYCAFLSEEDGKEDDRLTAMHRCANRTWLLCLHSMDLLRSLQVHVHAPSPKGKGQSVETVNLKESLCHSLEKMSHHMRRLARLITQVTFDFKNDENIVYFLLRHREEFDALYGEHFVNKLLLKMFPKGLIQAERFMCRRYKARSFHDLLPTISQKIKELQNG